MVSKKLFVLEANIDDMSAELLALLPGVCLEAGALDAWLAPVLMKKGRPAHLVSALCPPESADAVERALFLHSTTLGVRRHEVERAELDRDWLTVETPWGPIRVKAGRLDGEIVNLAPEFEECAAAASRAGVPVREVMAEAATLARAAVRRAAAV